MNKHHFLTQIFILTLFTTAAQAQTSRLDIPFGTGVMTCGSPDPRETLKDGTYQCVNDYKKTVVNAKFSLKAGKLEGPGYGYTEDGDPAYEGHFKSGLQDGEVKTNYNKSLKRWEQVEHFKAGKREGLKITFGQGDNQNIEYYANDKKQGWTYQLTKGKLTSVDDCKIADETPASTAKCDSFIIPGYQAQWSAYKGTVADKAAQEQAEANRLVETKNKAGVVVERYLLKNSQVFGKHEEFFDNGKPYLVSEQVASLKKNETEYFDDGHIKRKSIYEEKPRRQGAELERSEWYQNGKPKMTFSRQALSDGFFKVNYKTFYDNGQLEESGARKGRLGYDEAMRAGLDGVRKLYSDKGLLLVMETWKDGQLDGESVSNGVDDAKNAVVFTDTYKNGKLLKRITANQQTKKTVRETTYMPDGSVAADKKF